MVPSVKMAEAITVCVKRKLAKVPQPHSRRTRQAAARECREELAPNESGFLNTLRRLGRELL